VALSTELGNEPAASRAWDTVAYAHHHLGRYAEAVAAYQSAIELFRAGGDRYHEACTMDRLADSLHAAGDTAAARRTWRTALAVLTGLDPPWADEVRAKLTAVAAVE
jgi:tetratricopeptide (TPR) repeat protein